MSDMPLTLVRLDFWSEQWTPGYQHGNNDEKVTVFIISVDGVHCRINEPKHPTLSRDKRYYSHKFNQAAVNYELGILFMRIDLFG
jgi:hypothetical protein